MRRSWSLLIALVLLLVTATRAAPLPDGDSDAVAPDSLVDREHIVQSLEEDISRTALLAAAARAVREQQTFENDIMKDTVATLVRDRGDPEQLRRDVRQLKELVAQDQAQVEILSAVLRAPRQAEGGASASASAGSDSGSILSLLPTLLGGSSGGNGGGDDDDDDDDGGGGGGGGGSDSGSILQLIPAVLGGSSGSGGTGDSGGGGSNVLSLVSGLFGASSGGGGGGGGGGDGEGGGGEGSNFLSLVSGLLGASSGGGGESSRGFKGLVLDKIAPTSTVKPEPGTYDDLIGKGLTGYDPVAVFSSNLGGAIRTKFNVFNSLFSVLTSVLGASSGGGGGGGGEGLGVAASLSKS